MDKDMPALQNPWGWLSPPYRQPRRPCRRLDDDTKPAPGPRLRPQERTAMSKPGDPRCDHAAGSTSGPPRQYPAPPVPADQLSSPLVTCTPPRPVQPKCRRAVPCRAGGGGGGGGGCTPCQWSNPSPLSVLSFDNATISNDNFLAYQLDTTNQDNALSVRLFRTANHQQEPSGYYTSDPFYVMLLRNTAGEEFQVQDKQLVGSGLTNFTNGTLVRDGIAMSIWQLDFTIEADGDYYLGLWWDPNTAAGTHLLEGIVEATDPTLRSSALPTEPTENDTYTLTLHDPEPVNNLWFQSCSQSCT